MTDGPNGPVIDLLSEVRYELLCLNEQMRDLRGVAGRELPAPLVEVLPAPVVVQPGQPSAPASVDLRPLLAALQGMGSQNDVVKALEGLQQEIKDYQGIIRAIAGSAYGGGVGASVVTAGGVFPVSHAEQASPFRVSVVGSAPDSRSLTERMLARAPVDGYVLALDVQDSDASYVYIAEAPAGSAEADAVWRGVRVPFSASGNPSGVVRTAADFAWASRAGVTWQ